MRVELQVLSCVCRFSVHVNVDAFIFFSVYCTVQEAQTVSSDISPCELNFIVHSNYMFCEGFNFPCSDFHQGVVPSSHEGNEGSVLDFFHVEVGHYCGHRWADSPALLLSVESFTVMEVGGLRHRPSREQMSSPPLPFLWWKCMLKVRWHRRKQVFHLGPLLFLSSCWQNVCQPAELGY